MELTPQTLHAVEFREARRGGYNTRDVDDFLERVAQGVQDLHNRIRDVMMRAESAESRAADAQRQIEEMHRRPPAPEVSETDDTLRRTLVLAQRTADATIKEAKDEAARLLSEAREEAAHTRSEIEAEARRGTEGARMAAEAELEQLIDTRDSLKRDIDALGDQMRAQRERIRTGIAELERALDDPHLLEPVPPIALTHVQSPGETGRHSRVELPAPPPAPAPLPSRRPAVEHEPAANGQAHEPAVPFLPGTQVAALQEAPAGIGGPAHDAPHAPPPPPLPSRDVPPPLPSRPRQGDLAPTPAAPFAFNGNGQGNGAEAAPAPNHAPWPSQLRTSLDDAPDNGAPPAANGQGPLGIDGSRPSEWGRPVFDRGDDDEHSHFGTR